MAEKTKRKRRKKQDWKIGDVFAIRLSNGTYSYGQVLSYEEREMWSIICAFFNLNTEEMIDPTPLDKSQILAVQYTTMGDIDMIYGPEVDYRGWIVVGHQKSFDPQDFLDVKAFRKTREVEGERPEPRPTIVGSGNINNLFEVYFALKPWDMYFEPEYFDGLLIRPNMKPENIFYKKDISE